MTANPVSPVAVALLLAIPGVWLAGRALAWTTIQDLWLARLTSPGFALALWLLAVHLAGLATGSFEPALWLGTLTIAALGSALHLSGRVGPPAIGWVPTRGLLPTVLASAAVIAVAAFSWAIHDELFITGHMSITAALQNGTYPPPNLSFPAFELRYHYGFDILNAALTSIFRIPIDVGIDAITVLSWGWTLALLWAAGDVVLGRGRGWIAAVVVLFAAGTPFICFLTTDVVAEVLLCTCSTGGVRVNPPVVSYFFQHPWTIGIPLALTLLFVFAGSARAAVRYPVISLLLLALAISQIVLFAALAVALVVAEAWDGRKLSIRQGGLMLLASLAAFGIATRLGGFFAAWPLSVEASFALRAGIADGLGPVVGWHIASFGLLLPLGLYGLVSGPPGRVRTLLVCLVLGSLAVLNGIEYTHSWDIAKFATVALLCLAAGGSLVIARLFERGRSGAALGLLTASALGGITFVLGLALPIPAVPEEYFTRNPAYLSPQDIAAVEWLRQEADPQDVVYRARPASMGYAQWGGLPQARLGAMAASLGLPPDLLEERERLFTDPMASAEGFLAQGIRWVVIGPDDDTMAGRVTDWASRGVAVERVRFGDVVVFELLPPGAAARPRVTPGTLANRSRGSPNEPDAMRVRRVFNQMY